MNLVGELIIGKSMLHRALTEFDQRHARDPVRAKLAEALGFQSRVLDELHKCVLKIRMVPVEQLFRRFPRVVRDVAKQCGKDVALDISGQHTDLDKSILDALGEPLMHLVRNAVDHGIEPADERLTAGKPARGTVYLNAYHQGTQVVIEVRDDGRGIDLAQIREHAVKRGLMKAEDAQRLPDNEVLNLIFEPGFSTAAEVTEVSGRGVGMDVVRRNVKELGGKIELRSERGKGSRFIITLPLTLAIVDGQSVAVGSETYIIPLISIVESMRLKETSISRLSGHNEVFSFRGDYLPIIRLHELFGVEPRARALHEGLVVIAEGDGRRVGLFVDDLLGQQQVVIKSLEVNYGHVEGVSGATILGDGSVALILDVTGIIHAASMRAAA